MGADAVIVFYGVRFEITEEDDDVLEALEDGSDERMVRANAEGLDSWFGRLTDGGPHHLLIGRKLGDFGVECSAQGRIVFEELSKIVDETGRKLSQAGFRDEPALHVQLEAQY